MNGWLKTLLGGIGAILIFMGGVVSAHVLSPGHPVIVERVANLQHDLDVIQQDQKDFRRDQRMANEKILAKIEELHSADR